MEWKASRHSFEVCHFLVC